MPLLYSTANHPLWVLPLISASAWFIMLWAMLITYLASGRPFYPSMERGNLAYISDIGAFKLRPLFITFSTITSIFFLLSLLAMRFHQELSTRYERLLDLGALLSGFLGAVGLILLSIFDTNKHGHLHALFLFFFMFGVCLSALFSTLEYRRLGKTFTEHRILKWSFRGKAAVFVVEIALSVAFAVLMSKRMQNQAAAVEWVVAFVFTFYLCTFVLDLVPHARTKEDLGREMGMVKGVGGEMRERTGEEKRRDREEGERRREEEKEQEQEQEVDGHGHGDGDDGRERDASSTELTLPPPVARVG